MPQVTFQTDSNGQQYIQQGKELFRITTNEHTNNYVLEKSNNWKNVNVVDTVILPEGVNGIRIFSDQLRDYGTEKAVSFSDMRSEFRAEIDILRNRVASVETDNKFAGLVEGAGKLVNKLPTGTTMALANTTLNVTVDEPSKGRLA